MGIVDNRVRSNPKGATIAGGVTSTNQGVNREGLDIQVRTSTGGVVDDFATASKQDAGQNTVKDAGNTTVLPLLAGGVYIGTATDVLKYVQINVLVKAVPGAARASLYLEFSPDGVNWDVSIPNYVRNPELVITSPLAQVGQFYRLRYLNDGGASAIADLGLVNEDVGVPVAQTELRLTSYLLPQATPGLSRTLDQTISDGDPVTFVRAVQSGRPPDGAYGNVAISGVVSSNSTFVQLGASASFVGQVFGATDYANVSVSVVSDQDGLLEYDWSSDGVSVVHSDTHRVYANVPFEKVRSVNWAFFRIRYTNIGASPTTTLALQTILKTAPASPSFSRVNEPVNTSDLVAKVVAVPIDGVRHSYSAAISNLDTGANPTDIFNIAGSATKTIRLTRLSVSGDSSANDRLNFDIVRRSTANAGGTSTVLANVKHDTNNPAAAATVRAYTANPTVGSLVGAIDSVVLLIPNTAGNEPTKQVWVFGDRAAQAIVLRGAAESISINLGGAAVGTTTALSLAVEWVEE